VSDYTYQENDLLIPVTVKDATGALLDLSGGSAEYQISKRGDETALVSLSTGTSGVTLTDAANGELEVDLSNTDTAIPHGDYVHELRVTLSDGRQFTVFSDPLTIRNSIFAAD
jgi:hypothetical protein